mmetsp:Transcript_11995/g.20331  ORF Transcript_11995/g.20331 Transcript_11995/m.20331 type:complete len:111 (-) Transcript_11995:144-476(-)
MTMDSKVVLYYYSRMDRNLFLLHATSEARPSVSLSGDGFHKAAAAVSEVSIVVVSGCDNGDVTSFLAVGKKFVRGTTHTIWDFARVVICTQICGYRRRKGGMLLSTDCKH